MAALAGAPAGLSRTDVHRVLGRNHTASQIEAALGLLEAEGRARRSERQTNGRAAEVWYAVLLFRPCRSSPVRRYERTN